MADAPRSVEGWLERFEAYATGQTTPGYGSAAEAIAAAIGAVRLINEEARDLDGRSLIEAGLTQKPELVGLLARLIRGLDAISGKEGYSLASDGSTLRLSFNRR